jgi:SAM-dependent methyltransferase
MMICTICCSQLRAPVFESPAGLTSMGTPASWPIRVRFCEHCTHISTDPPGDEQHFYATEYRICDDAEDEDQLYDNGEQTRTRTAQQVELLLGSTLLPPSARVLSLGAAKASTLRGLSAKRPDIVPHAFDVTARYQSSWNAWLTPEQQAVGSVPPAWNGQMDVVYLLFVAEHVSDLAALAQQARLALREAGELRVLVPNVFSNPGDLVVADHVHHFTHASLRSWLERAGFTNIRIDAAAHAGALFASASNATAVAGISDMPGTLEVSPRVIEAETQEVRRRLDRIVRYWSEFTHRVREAEADRDGEIAIFGAGFYGRMIAGALLDSQRLVAFLDSNPWLQNREVNDRPVLSPSSFPEVATVFIGLNPMRARTITARVPELQRTDFAVVYP